MPTRCLAKARDIIQGPNRWPRWDVKIAHGWSCNNHLATVGATVGAASGWVSIDALRSPKLLVCEVARQKGARRGRIQGRSRGQ